MALVFYIPSPLRALAEGKSEVTLEVSAATVGEALVALWARYPGLRDRIVTEQGTVREHVNIFVNDENIRYTGGLATLVTSDSKIYLIPAVSGGIEATVPEPPGRARTEWLSKMKKRSTVGAPLAAS